MKYATQYLQTAVSILQGYSGNIPLQHYLKSFFASEKKYGSKDRKHISHLCYSYFRLGHALKDIAIAERIVCVLFLSLQDEWELLYPKEWQGQKQLTLKERLLFIQAKFPSFQLENIFPFNPLSANMDEAAFALSHLQQPKLFIRIRKGKEALVEKKLKASNLSFEKIDRDCFAFKNNTRLEDVLVINEEYVVQDLNSQRVGAFLKEISAQPVSVWDCCAASGGKAIMASDLLSVKKLLVTDVRDTIIKNLRARFKEAGVKQFSSAVIDVTDETSVQKALGKERFNLVICDAPCSGSGTWGRTPEQLFFFTPDRINHYSNLQKKIASNAVKYVADEGYLLYITCSVLQQENEQVVAFIKEKFHLQLVRMELLKGYDKQADTMFAALFKK